MAYVTKHAAEQNVVRRQVLMVYSMIRLITDSLFLKPVLLRDSEMQRDAAIRTSATTPLANAAYRRYDISEKCLKVPTIKALLANMRAVTNVKLVVAAIHPARP